MGKSTRTNARQPRENAKQETPEISTPTLGWEDLQLLLALVRTGTLTGAGKRLDINASTVARRLDAMEANLNAHLFDRTPSGIAPTNMAECLVPAAEAMEQAAAEALLLVEGRETEPEGTVRISAPPGVANWLLAPRLVELRRRFPRLQVELDASVGYVSLTRREADLALRAVRPRSGDLITVRLVEVDLVVATEPTLARKARTAKAFAELDWITWGPDLAHLPDAVWLSKNVPSERIALRTSSMDAQLHAARTGLGALLLPRPFLTPTGLVEVPLDESAANSAPLPRGSLWLVGHRALKNIPRIRSVWDFLIELSGPWS